jgi:hypothetical protein
MALAMLPAVSLDISYAQCSTIRKGWWFSSRMVHSSDGGEGHPCLQLHRAVVQPTEDA